MRCLDEKSQMCQGVVKELEVEMAVKRRIAELSNLRSNMFGSDRKTTSFYNFDGKEKMLLLGNEKVIKFNIRGV